MHLIEPQFAFGASSIHTSEKTSEQENYTQDEQFTFLGARNVIVYARGRYEVAN